MKILITSTHIPPFCGGAEQIAWESAVCFTKKGHEVTILTLGNKNDEIREGINIKYLSKKPFLTIYYSLFTKNLKTKINSEEFDIIQHHMLLPWGFILRNEKTKKVITCHGEDIILKEVIRKLFTKKALMKTDKIICISKYMQNVLKENYGLGSRLIYNGINLDLFKKNINKKKETNLVLYVGRLILRKGIKELSEVAKELKDVNFEIIGTGPLNKYFVELSNVNIKGFIDKKDIVKEYNRATIAVFPSHFEPFGLVALEAMACGCPIIVTKKTGFQEFVKNNQEGVLINPKNIKQLKTNITRLLSDKNKQDKLSKNGIEKAKEFSINSMSEKYLVLYSEILKD